MVIFKLTIPPPTSELEQIRKNIGAATDSQIVFAENPIMPEGNTVAFGTAPDGTPKSGAIFVIGEPNRIGRTD